MTTSVAAIDLGATSGRVMVGHVGPNELALHAVARFANTPVRTPDGLHWNTLGLYRSALDGLQRAVREDRKLASIAVDSWAVDYALLSHGRMVGNPFHYRDERSLSGVEKVHGLVDPADLYDVNGLQHLPFNTLFQLVADQSNGLLGGVDRILLIPDLLNYWLTGSQVTERTNASTTGLINARTGEWDDELIATLGLRRDIFTELISAGESVGPLRGSVAAELQAPADLQVTAVGSHDTASAVVGVPMLTDDAAYISCGTWGLVGVELEAPVLTAASRIANFTNEGGVDGRFRFLTNVMGLWLLSESVRTWERDGHAIDLPALLAQAAQIESAVPVFDVQDERFLAPGDIPTRIAEFCRDRGLKPPTSRPEFVRSIVESLAAAFATAIDQAQSLSGKAVNVVHVVGGGSLNELLCQLTADRTGRVVLAGPVEATALGNVLIQARTVGAVDGDLESLRALIAHTHTPRRYEPRADVSKGS